MSITIFYTVGDDPRRREHEVSTKEAGAEWIEEMCLKHRDFCITGTAIHRVSTSFGAACAAGNPLRPH